MVSGGLSSGLSQQAAELNQIYDQLGGKPPEGAPPAVQNLFDEISKSRMQSVSTTSESGIETIFPRPEFVVKTADETGRKVFINICSSEKVQPPESWEDGCMPSTVRTALQNLEEVNDKDTEALRVPLSLSEQRSDYDKSGKICSVFDCVFSDVVIKEATSFRPMKVFVIECAMGWIQHKCKIQLDPKFKLPKLKYKGDEIQEHHIRKQQRPMVKEIRDKENHDEPTLPLCSRKATKASENMGSKTLGGIQKGETATSAPVKDSNVKPATPQMPLISLRSAELESVHYDGKPCSTVRVTAKMNSSSCDRENISIKVGVDCVHVSVKEGEPLAVKLNVYVDPEKSVCKLEERVLTISCFCIDIEHLISIAENRKALQIGDLKLKSFDMLKRLD